MLSVFFGAVNMYSSKMRFFSFDWKFFPSMNLNPSGVMNAMLTSGTFDNYSDSLTYMKENLGSEISEWIIEMVEFLKIYGLVTLSSQEKDVFLSFPMLPLSALFHQ